MRGQAQPAALVLVNLGTPVDCTPSAVRAFLRQFLGDRRVVEVPRPLWWLILNLFVLPLRPAKVARAYRAIWTAQGSPLRHFTEQQAAKLQERLTARHGPGALHVRHAMTYGTPSIAQTLDELWQQGCRRILLLPLYPQYSGSTSGAVYDQIAHYICRRRALPGLHIINSYFHHPAYIAALAQSVRDHWQAQGRADLLLFSYHGVPQSYVDRGDPYAGHCECTTGALAAALGLQESDYRMTYQSRFGRAPWLQPYTDATLVELAQTGVKRIDVLCPAFAADCLETLEEIAVENRHLFIEHGGADLRLIPCLNASTAHIDMLEAITAPHLDAILRPGQPRPPAS
ncbi:MAG: ferrochelatase [Cellvibrionales bacterium]|nr:ferrochelatase [Cellvibrionales bacterium]